MLMNFCEDMPQKHTKTRMTVKTMKPIPKSFDLVMETRILFVRHNVTRISLFETTFPVVVVVSDGCWMCQVNKKIARVIRPPADDITTVE